MPSAAVQPKQILKRAPSQKEYEFLQEWAPETLKNYELPPQQTVFQPPQAAPVKEQGIHNHRNPRLRTSSLYEDWKAHASSSQGENANKECTPSPHASAQKIDHLPQPASLKAAPVVAEKPHHCLQSRTNAKGSQQVGSKSNTLHSHHYAQPTVSANNRFNTVHAGDRKSSKSVAEPANVPHESQQTSQPSSSSPTTPEVSTSVHKFKSILAPEVKELHHPRISNLSAAKASKPTETSKPAEKSKPSDENQQKQNLIGSTPTAAQTSKPTESTKKAVEGRQKPRTGSSICYTAPNGTRFPRHNDLLKWSIGVKNQHNDLVIFMPVFVESPWKGLKPILTTCASRYW
ncbi:hypothetical protein BO86DRAFT_438695 [Aspergillus japonicus CBS 114.51]|uniref:Uncharacterized protein n=1 Tax=Aspergillus japonicus CBS 114.51 TaxID=1448312 RepID=A0A8T8XD08_ASPJA|nr:hypothetical protein BO86DRAFT_438695 [Aspergillus japonicus CBS 114.51]RAH85282.1 hypothetical protein BO86DRAFT_438695 [Aspergillus japonicus CBS 114.51]